MTFPIFPDKYKSDGTTSAIDILLNSNKVDSLSKLPPAPKSCILCPSDFPVKYLTKTHKLKEGPRIIKPIYILNEDISVFTGFIGFGSPMWIWALEQLIAYGIKQFIFIGFFGKVNPSIKPHKLIIVEKALRDEGTSYHYAPPSKWAYPDEELTNRLLSHKDTVASSLWTTDAMFKQTKPEITYANENGIAGFDSETSALFSVAKARGCRIASIQIESDSFINNTWKTVYDAPDFNINFTKAINLAVNILSK